MQEPGIDEHMWISEWEQLSPFLEESPIEAIPEVHRLITEMMEARGVDYYRAKLARFRALSHVTLQFVERIGKRFKQLELASMMI